MSQSNSLDSHTSIALLAMSLGIEKLPSAVMGVLAEVVTKKVVRGAVDTEGFSCQNNAHINALDVINSTGGHKRLREWLDKVETEEVGVYAEEIAEQDPGDVSWGRSEVGVDEGVEGAVDSNDVDDDDDDDDDDDGGNDDYGDAVQRTRPYPSHLPPPHPMVVMKLADVESDMSGLDTFKREVAETWGSGGGAAKKHKSGS